MLKCKKENEGINHEVGGIFRRGVTLSGPAQGDWGETPTIHTAADLGGRSTGAKATKKGIVIAIRHRQLEAY